MDDIRRPPKSALKTIGAGRLKGFSNINPQWRIDAMNDKYGMCGEGWTWEIVKLWFDDCPNGERVAHAHVQIKVKDGAWIPGIGGNKLIANERNRAHVSDEGYKMAITDALSSAMKCLGVGADVYLALWDDKYGQWKEPAKQLTPDQMRKEIVNLCESCNTVEQWGKAKELCKSLGLFTVEGKEYLNKLFNEWDASNGQVKDDIEGPFYNRTGEPE